MVEGYENIGELRV